MRRAQPSREIQLIFLLTGTEARRRALLPRARSVLGGVDFGALERELAERRLLALIGSRILAAAPELVPAGFKAAAAAARNGARAQGLLMEWCTGRVTAQLAGCGIRALALKGPLLAEAAHQDIGLRDTTDIDLLIAPEDLDPAVALLTGAGYLAPREPVHRDGLPDLHFSLEHPRLPRVDLHWRVHWYERKFSQDMLGRATAGPDGLLRADPGDLAASLLLFYARDGFHGVRLAADLAAWWDRRGHELDPAFLAPHARAYPKLRPALHAAARVGEALTGVPATRWLGSTPKFRRRVALGTRLADWTQIGDRDQLAANISLVGGLLGPRGSLPAFAWRELRAEQGRAATIEHASKMCARYALGLWRVRGGRVWTETPLTLGAPSAREDGGRPSGTPSDLLDSSPRVTS